MFSIVVIRGYHLTVFLKRLMKYTMAVRERYVVDLHYCYHVVTVFDGKHYLRFI